MIPATAVSLRGSWCALWKSCHIAIGILALLAYAGPAHSQTVITIIGTGADAGVSWQALTGPINVSSLQQSFNLLSCTVPSGTCTNGVSQFGYSAPGGTVRLTQDGGSTRTWSFSSWLHNGYYTSAGGSGFSSGTMIVSGIDATAGTPQSNAPGAGFQFPLEVTVTNPTPAYVSGASITFSAPSSGASASLPNGGVAITDGTGRASLTPTANGTAGVYQIIASATVGGNAVQTVFVLANVNTAVAGGACVVTNANDDLSAGSLRSQIATCGKGGTITFDPGVTSVSLSQYQEIPLTQDLTIDGGSGVTISGNVARIFFISGGTISLKNLTLTSGNAAGGPGGAGIAGGGGAAGMGGAIFLDGGSLLLDTVTFTDNNASGGSGGDSGIVSGSRGGGGGAGVRGGAAISTQAGNGGGGGAFGTSGGAGVTGGAGGSGSGAGAGGGGGNTGGSGGFGAGGGAPSGTGGFGGGGSGNGIAGGSFGGNGGPGGGGGAGLGGAIFANAGTLQLKAVTFTSNTASKGSAGAGGTATGGQGKGGALFINSAAVATFVGAAPTFNFNSASDAGAGTLCNTVVGAAAFDTVNVCGVLLGPATHFSLSYPATVTSSSAQTLTVKALDVNNNVVTSYSGTVHISSTDSAFVDATGDSTLTNGQGQFNVTLKTAGNFTITAADTVNSSITGTASVHVDPGAAANLAVTASSPQPSGTAFSITVTATDLAGNTATGYTGTIHFTSSDGTATLPSNYIFVVGDQGVHTFSNVVLNTNGNQTVTATDLLSSPSGFATINVFTLTAPTFTMAFSPTTVEVGGNSTMTLTVTNTASITLHSVAFSDTMPVGLALVTQQGGTCGTLSTGGGTTTLNPPNILSITSTQLTAGQTCTAVFTVKGTAVGARINTSSTITSTEIDGSTATATLTVNADIVPTISQSFTPNSIAAGAPSQLSFTIANPNTTISLTGVSFTDTLPSGVTVASPNGLAGSCGGGTINAVAGASSISLSGATVAASSQCTFSVNVTGTTVGVKSNTTSTVTSTEAGNGLTASAILTVTPGAATHFSVSAPGTAVAGTAFNVTVTALDQFDNTVTAYAGTVHFTSTDGIAVLPANFTLTNGTATVSATLKTAGSRSITATDTVTPGITGLANITVSPTAATHLSVAAPGAATAGVALNFTVTALDQFENTATAYGGTVHFTASDAAAILPANATLTNGAGVFSATLKTAGTRTLSAADTVSGAIAGTSGNIVVSAAAASHFTVSTPGTTLPGAAFGFTVAAFDSFNNAATTYAGTVHFSSTDPAATVPADATLAAGAGSFSATLRTPGVQAITATDTVAGSITGNGAVAVVVPPSLSVIPGAVVLQYVQGTTPPSPIQTFSVSANGLNVGFSVLASQPWLVAPSTGNSANGYGVNLDPAGLTPGTYIANLFFSSASGGLQVPVTLTVVAPPTLASDPASLRLSATAGSSAGNTVAVQLTSGDASLAFTAASNVPWLTVTSSNTTTPATLQIQADPSHLSAGTYQGAIAVTANGAANSPFSIPVTYLLSGGSNAAVTNSASYQQGIAAPNTILTLFDPLGCGSSGTQVTVNGIAAQVLFSGGNQINFATPGNIGTSGNAVIQAACNGAASGSITVPLGPVDPGVFTANSSGSGQGSIVNFNGTVNNAASPIARGSYISVYVTGFGPYNPPDADGLTRLQFPVTATIGNVPATVTYAGSAPTETSGLQQINIQVPADAPSGSSVPLVLTVNGVSTQTGITVAIN